MAKKNVTATIQSENEVYKLIKIFLILIICFGIFWGITTIVTKHQSNTVGNSASQERLATIQYDKILVGELFNQKRDHYYVYLDQSDHQYYTLYSSYISSYMSKEDATKIYTVDMLDPFNKAFWSNESQLDVEELADLKVKEATILEVQDREIIKSYEGHEEVSKFFEDLLK